MRRLRTRGGRLRWARGHAAVSGAAGEGKTRMSKPFSVMRHARQVADVRGRPTVAAPPKLSAATSVLLQPVRRLEKTKREMAIPSSRQPVVGRKHSKSLISHQYCRGERCDHRVVSANFGERYDIALPLQGAWAAPSGGDQMRVFRCLGSGEARGVRGSSLVRRGVCRLVRACEGPRLPRCRRSVILPQIGQGCCHKSAARARKSRGSTPMRRNEVLS